MPDETPKTYGVFISHASKDKTEVARPLAQELERLGLKVWLDEYELTMGDSLRRKIDRGLTQSRFGVVILSPNFFAKEWPQRELDALVAIEGEGKVILPVLHHLTKEQLIRYSPLLAGKLAVSTDRGISLVAAEILLAIKRESGEDVKPEAREDYWVQKLSQLRARLQVANSIRALRQLEYELEDFFANYPINADGKMLKRDLLYAIEREKRWFENKIQHLQSNLGRDHSLGILRQLLKEVTDLLESDPGNPTASHLREQVMVEIAKGNRIRSQRLRSIQDKLRDLQQSRFIFLETDTMQQLQRLIDDVLNDYPNDPEVLALRNDIMKERLRRIQDKLGLSPGYDSFHSPIKLIDDVLKDYPGNPEVLSLRNDIMNKMDEVSRYFLIKSISIVGLILLFVCIVCIWLFFRTA